MFKNIIIAILLLIIICAVIRKPETAYYIDNETKQEIQKELNEDARLDYIYEQEF